MSFYNSVYYLNVSEYQSYTMLATRTPCYHVAICYFTATIIECTSLALGV